MANNLKREKHANVIIMCNFHFSTCMYKLKFRKYLYLQSYNILCLLLLFIHLNILSQKVHDRIANYCPLFTDISYTNPLTLKQVSIFCQIPYWLCIYQLTPTDLAITWTNEKLDDWIFLVSVHLLYSCTKILHALQDWVFSGIYVANISERIKHPCQNICLLLSII